VTGEELFSLWAPRESIWSPWVIPVPFAQMNCLGSADQSFAAQKLGESSILDAADSLAIVVDLPGGEAIRFGLALAQRGFRSVPVLDGSPSPLLAPVSPQLQYEEARANQIVVVDMTALLAALCGGGKLLKTLSLAPNAPPAFLLDSMRLSGERNVDKALYDNRWKIIPQDFPSAAFLKQQGIRQVILVQKERRQPQEDLAEALLRWQRAGLEILVSDEKHTREAKAIRITEPLGLRASWRRLLEAFGFLRNSVAAFGAYPYEGSSG
jgi:hypothetical protein